MRNNGLAKCRAGNQGRTFHEALKIVGDGFGLNSAVHAINDEICSFIPSQDAAASSQRRG